MTELESDRAVRTRRRGQVLEEAIFAAVLSELAERGYGTLSMEGVAEAAGTGKSALYRRWKSKQDLVLDTLIHTLPSTTVRAKDTGELRGDLTFLLGRMSRVMETPVGQVMRSVIAEGDRQPQIVHAVDDTLIQPRIKLIYDAFVRAAERGEIETAEGTWIIARTGPALIIQQLLLTGRPPDRAGVAEMIDKVIFPALGLPR
ncbi:TetR/AcrR family transcriptional regulator [Amycolatopsis anabasis]|uniref:TetR/AcrR family transcriptional regulator n=1 Tax=Amycolatopsis anabasis TaxID=1840409 RepID=UPI00131CA52E|nr:TetR/AcrR family transcriptional regulator [Amycolatopsis anabasis]